MGVRQQWEGGRGGKSGVGLAAKVGVSSTSKNRPSYHKYKSPKSLPLGATFLSRF